MLNENYTIVDLSLKLCQDAIVFPGDTPPSVSGPFSFVPGAHREFVYSLEMSTQSGTHIQGQHYFLGDGKKIDEYPLHRFEGPARVIDCRAVKYFDAALLHNVLGDADLSSQMLLFFTGFGAEIRARMAQRGGRLRVDDILDKPELTLDGAKFLVRRGARFLGVDSVGFEPYPTEDHAVNRFLCANDVLLLENLTNLGLVPEAGAWLECFPLPFTEVEGTPCRAIVKIPGRSLV